MSNYWCVYIILVRTSKWLDIIWSFQLCSTCEIIDYPNFTPSIIYRNAILPVLYTILSVFSDGELSDSEWPNLTQLTVDGHVKIIVDNIEHSHDSVIH